MAYVDNILKDHDKDGAERQKKSSGGRDPQVKRLARYRIT